MTGTDILFIYFLSLNDERKKINLNFISSIILINTPKKRNKPTYSDDEMKILTLNTSSQFIQTRVMINLFLNTILNKLLLVSVVFVLFILLLHFHIKLSFNVFTFILHIFAGNFFFRYRVFFIKKKNNKRNKLQNN